MSAAAVTVRRAALPAERHVLEALHDAFLEVHYDALFYDELEHDSGCVSLVALVDGGIVGVATARDRLDDDLGFLRRQLAYWLWGSRPGYVMTLGVLPAFRGRGVGSALLRALCAALGAAGCSEVQLHCLASNVAGRALYAAHGFAETAALAGFYSFGGRRHDAVAMASPLEPGGLPAAAPPAQLQPGASVPPARALAPGDAVISVHSDGSSCGSLGSLGGHEVDELGRTRVALAAAPATGPADAEATPPPGAAAARPRAWWLPGLVLSVLWPQR